MSVMCSLPQDDCTSFSSTGIVELLPLQHNLQKDQGTEMLVLTGSRVRKMKMKKSIK